VSVLPIDFFHSALASALRFGGFLESLLLFLLQFSLSAGQIDFARLRAGWNTPA
jgi:hypothetical protein